MEADRIWLLGREAENLAERLKVSGYALCSGPEEHPDVVVLSAAEQGTIPRLRRSLGAVPMLLDVRHDTVEARAHCLSSGADDFWLSSLGPSDLLMRLRLQIGISRRVMGAPHLLQLGDLSLNPSTRQVTRNHRLIELTEREYRLLSLLMERQGAVVSRDLILRQVWDDRQGSTSNVIEVYVRYLRRKLEEGGEPRLLHTVRGQGYCLSRTMPPRGAQ